MIIGIFSRFEETGCYTGGITTIGFDRPVTFEPVTHKCPSGPDYLLLSHQRTELGAAWKRSGKDGSYLSVKLDSPVLPRPLHCMLVGQADSSHALIWHRDRAKDDVAASTATAPAARK